jgi:tRNA G18 (ribose-2'-O)-methylase SpoU
MPIVRPDDGSDPRLADYAGVRDPALLRARGLLIAEGRFVVRRLFDDPRIRVRSLLLNAAAGLAFEDLIERVGETVDIFIASPQVIEAATGFHMHRGCLAVVERPTPRVLDDMLASSRSLVVLERVVDPDNVGSVFRSAEAFGIDGVVLSPGCGDPFYRKSIRTSSGATLVVPHAEGTPWPDALRALRAAGFIVVGTTPRAEAMDIGTFAGTPAARGRVAVLLGTEGHGLSPEALEQADVSVRIPMTGALDSLNIATAAGIVLHRLHDVRRGQ